MAPRADQPATDAPESELALLRRQLEREGRARRTAESLGETATAQLWQTVRDLEAARAELESTAAQDELSHRLVREMRRDLDPQRLMSEAVTAVGTALEVDRCLIRLADEGSVGLIVGQWSAATVEPLPDGVRLPAGLERLVLETSRRHEALWIDDLHADERLTPAEAEAVARRLGVVSYAGAPLLAGSRLVGWIVLQATTQPRTWSDRDRAVLVAVARDLGGAMLQAMAHQQQSDTLRQLEVLDVAKSEFVSRVSHEVRTPLASISGYVEMLADETAGPLNAEQTQILAVVTRNCERILTMVDDLLVLARLDDASGVPGAGTAYDAVDVAALVVDVHAAVTPLLVPRDVVLVVSSVPEEARCRGNPQEIERVLINLLSNAIKFSPPRGQVSLVTELTDGSVVFTVADHGIGISAEDQEQLFRRFFRSRTAIEQAVPGTGLGLSLVKSIVDAHGGTVSVVSEVGRGTTVTVWLPLLAA